LDDLFGVKYESKNHHTTTSNANTVLVIYQLIAMELHFHRSITTFTTLSGSLSFPFIQLDGSGTTGMRFNDILWQDSSWCRNCHKRTRNCSSRLCSRRRPHRSKRSGSYCMGLGRCHHTRASHTCAIIFLTTGRMLEIVRGEQKC
jgi:hypothetical protein